MLLGDDDAVMTRDVLKGVERFCDDLSVISVAGASHFLADDRPDAVAAAVNDFFAADG